MHRRAGTGYSPPGSPGRSGLIAGILRPSPVSHRLARTNLPGRRFRSIASAARHGGKHPSGRTVYFQSWGITCAQTPIIPTKSVSEISAAASSTNTFSIFASYGTYEEHCSLFVHKSQAPSGRMTEVVNGRLTRLKPITAAQGSERQDRTRWSSASRT